MLTPAAEDGQEPLKLYEQADGAQPLTLVLIPSLGKFVPVERFILKSRADPQLPFRWFSNLTQISLGPLAIYSYLLLYLEDAGAAAPGVPAPSEAARSEIFCAQ